MRPFLNRFCTVSTAALICLACSPSFPAPARYGRPGNPGSSSATPVPSGSRPLVLNGVRNAVYRGEGARATLSGGGTNGIDIRNCSNVRIENITATGYFRGAFIQNCDNVELVGVTVTRNQKQGFFVHDSRNTTFRRCEGSLTGIEHALYLAETTDGALIEDCYFHGTPQSALQVNSEGGSFARNVVVRRTRVESRYGAYFLGAQFRMENCTLIGERPILCNGRATSGVVRNCQIDGRVFLQGSQIDLDASNHGIFDIVWY